jgi:hypothetical protein
MNFADQISDVRESEHREAPNMGFNFDFSDLLPGCDAPRAVKRSGDQAQDIENGNKRGAQTAYRSRKGKLWYHKP